MPIPESQLGTWSHQGSVTQSKDTYTTIKRALEAPEVPYAGRSFESFLQGSYGNDTNVYADSDVDIVMKLNSTFYKDLSRQRESNSTPSARSLFRSRAALQALGGDPGKSARSGQS
jgi:hypothetical protein